MSPARLTGIAVAAGLAVSLCTLQMGLVVDDWGQIIRVRDALPDLGGPWDLFRFMGPDTASMQRQIAAGPWPWWSMPEVRAGFFRPLASALIHFDVKVLGDHVIAWHLHSIAWYLALLGVVLALYRRVLPGGSAGLAAAIALFFFAVDDAHWMPVGWLANRNSLVAVTPAIGGLLLHLRWREDGWKPGLWLSMLAYAVALLGGESALGALGFVGVYELTNVRQEALSKRVRALLPLGVVFVAWAAAYRAMGYGASGSAIYIDPLKEPGAYLAEAPGRFLALGGSMTLNIVSDLWMFAGTKGRAVLVAGGALGLVLFGLFIRRARSKWSEPEWLRIRWLIIGGLLAVLPVISTFPADRLLLVPSIASAAVFAATLHALWSETGALPRVARGLIIWTQVLAPLPAWVLSPYFLESVGTYVRNGVLHTELSDAQLSGHVVFIAAPDPMVGMYGPFLRALDGRGRPRAWHMISFAPYDHRVRRLSESSIEVEVLNGRMLDTVFESLFRHPRFPLEPGFVSHLIGTDVTVLASSEGRPTKVRVDFLEPLEGITFVQWKDDRLVKLELPPAGEELVLLHRGGPIDQLMALVGDR